MKQPTTAKASQAARPNLELTAVDLFCGIGGFHIAAREHGIRTIFACDSDPTAAKCYEANLGLRPYGDISECKHEVPPHDIMLAGFPCQPFSIIGKGVGFADPRGRLIYEAVEIADRRRPKAVILENVKRLSTHDKKRTIKIVVKLFADVGYNVDHRILNAQDFGLPQRRERTVIVALQPQYAPMEWPSEKPQAKTLRDILEADAHPRYYANRKIQENRKARHPDPIPPPAIWHQNKGDSVTSREYSSALRANSSHNYLLVNGERRLTEREMLRLQGFPEEFRPADTYQQARRHAGNAVPVPMASAVIGAVLKSLKQPEQHSVHALPHCLLCE